MDRTTPATARDGLKRYFEEMGLNGYQARVLVALLELGSASVTQLARLSGVPRTSVYSALEGLSTMGLAEPVPGQISLWTCPAREDVLEQLYEHHVERLAVARAKTDKAKALLARMPPQRPSGALPYVHLIRGTSQAGSCYEQLLSDARTEVVMFTRAPYSRVPGDKQQAVIDALARGVRIRVLYPGDAFDGPDGELLYREVKTYHDMGAEGRMVEDLPAKLVVADRTASLVALPDPVLAESGFPTVVLYEHPGFSSILADAFAQRWDEGQPMGRFLPACAESVTESIS